MEKIKKGDIVGRISYNEDIIFVVKKILKQKNGRKIAILKGLTERIEVDSKIEDLCIISKDRIQSNLRSLDNKLEKRIGKNQTYKPNIIKISRTNEKFITGKILHLDRGQKI